MYPTVLCYLFRCIRIRTQKSLKHFYFRRTMELKGVSRYRVPGNLHLYLHRRDEAVHVEAAVTIVAKQKLIVILRGAAQGAGLAFCGKK